MVRREVGGNRTSKAKTLHLGQGTEDRGIADRWFFDPHIHVGDGRGGPDCGPERTSPGP